MKKEYIKRHESDEYWWICICGNEPAQNGFFHSQAEKYKFPSSFIILDTVTGNESSPSIDVKHLMEILDILT